MESLAANLNNKFWNIGVTYVQEDINLVQIRYIVLNHLLCYTVLKYQIKLNKFVRISPEIGNLREGEVLVIM